MLCGLCTATATTAAETAVPVDEQVSLSCGAPNRGQLHGAWRLPSSGAGYQIPAPWRERTRNFGTRVLVWLIKDAARAVDSAFPGSVLGVADMSAEEGGKISGHKSHQSGRDVDLIYYARNASGHPLPPPDYMPYYNWRGKATSSRAPEWKRRISLVYFDHARNWQLVKALATHPDIAVAHIFVAYSVRRWLLDHAKKTGEDAEVIRRVREVLHAAPKAGSKHSDHMHVRIGCSMDDATLGKCRPARARRRRSAELECPVATPLTARSE